MFNSDVELGVGGVMVLPDQFSSHTKLLTHTGKEGTIYLIDWENMGEDSMGDQRSTIRAHTSQSRHIGCPVGRSRKLRSLGVPQIKRPISIRMAELSLPCRGMVELPEARYCGQSSAQTLPTEVGRSLLTPTTQPT